MTLQTDKMTDCAKTKEEPNKMKDSSKTTFEPEDIRPGDMIVRKGITHEPKEEYEWAKYIVLQKIVTTSRLRDEPRTAFKALLLSCHQMNHSLRESVGCICYITPHQFQTGHSSDWWETVVESGLSWDDSEPYKKVDLNSQTEEE